MITSSTNPHVKYVRSLREKRTRYAERRLAVEGTRLLEEVLSAGLQPELVLYEPTAVAHSERARNILDRMAASKLIAVSEHVLHAAADTLSPQGIVAVFPVPPMAVEVGTGLTLVLDGMQDPGNLGTILRTAAAAAVSTVLATPDTVDPWNPKAIRAGMGAQFRLGLMWDQLWPDIRRLAAGRDLLLAAAEGGTPYYEVDWRRPIAVIVGSEAHGAGTEAGAVATGRVSIPMQAGVESLNAAVAAAVLMFEAVRQRQLPS